MNNINPKISVVIITYKQEELIKRTINSLLKQREYIYEICVSDDCSPDNTWNVLQSFAIQYPDLFKIRRNKNNIGIFKHIEKAWEMPTGDMIYPLAGDDECGDDFFYHVIKFIHDNKVDYKNELFCIYGDYKLIWPNGKEKLYKNNLIAKGIDPLKLLLRRLLIDNRGACYSINIMKKFIKVSDEERTFAVELMQNCQLQLFAEKNYYIPYCGNIYYASIGLSTVIPSCEKYNSEILVYDKMKDFLIKQGKILDKKDIAYLEFYKQYLYYSDFASERMSFKQFFKIFKYYINSIDFSLGIVNGMQLNRFFRKFKKIFYKC